MNSLLYTIKEEGYTITTLYISNLYSFIGEEKWRDAFVYFCEILESYNKGVLVIDSSWHDRKKGEWVRKVLVQRGFFGRDPQSKKRYDPYLSHESSSENLYPSAIQYFPDRSLTVDADTLID